MFRVVDIFRVGTIIQIKIGLLLTDTGYLK